MCFRITKSKELTAAENIICYKIMEKLKSGSLVSHFQRNRFNLKQEYHAKNDWYKPIKKLAVRMNTIDFGFHSYKKIPRLIVFYCRERVIVKCLIPKNAQYYENRTEYVSTKIKFIKILK